MERRKSLNVLKGCSSPQIFQPLNAENTFFSSSFLVYIYNICLLSSLSNSRKQECECCVMSIDNDQAGRAGRTGTKETEYRVLLINLYPNSIILSSDLLKSNNQQQGRACSLNQNIFSLITKYPNIFSFICHTKWPKQEMFRNTTFTPPIGKMTTLLKSRHKAGIRKSNFAVCMDLIIKVEFLFLVAKCALLAVTI